MAFGKDVWFRLFDYCVAMLAGAVTASLTTLLVPLGWPAPLGMLLGMVVAMMLFFVLLLPVQLVSSPFEFAVPGMFLLMPLGMICGMASTRHNLSYLGLAALGLLAGLLVQGVFHLYDRSLHGEVKTNED